MGSFQEVEIIRLPEIIQQKVHLIAKEEFSSRDVDYGGSEKLEAIYGSINVVSATDTLYLFTFDIVDPYRSVLYLFLYDPNTQKITQSPIRSVSRSRISVSLYDIDHDGIAEVVADEYTHCGTECDWDTNHYYKICPDLSLKIIYDLITRSADHCNGVDCNKLEELILLPIKTLKQSVMSNYLMKTKKQLGR